MGPSGLLPRSSSKEPNLVPDRAPEVDSSSCSCPLGGRNRIEKALSIGTKTLTLNTIRNGKLTNRTESRHDLLNLGEQTGG